jgi:hypothetical protein
VEAPSADSVLRPICQRRREAFPLNNGSPALNASTINNPSASLGHEQEAVHHEVDTAPAPNALRWPMMAAIVFLGLLSGHLLGDWVAQTDWQATNKTRSRAALAALAARVASYHLIMALLLLIPVLRNGWPTGKALAAVTVSALTHGVIDRRWPVRALLQVAGSPGLATVEWGVIAVDQALHLFILAMLALLLA